MLGEIMGSRVKKQRKRTLKVKKAEPAREAINRVVQTPKPLRDKLNQGK